MRSAPAARPLSLPVRGLIAILFLLPLLAWWQNTGNPLLYLEPSAPAGQWAYVLSKLIALYAMLALTLQILAGLLLRKGHSPLHRYTGCLVLALMLSHAALFITGVSLRAGHIAWHLFLPDFNSGYYNAVLGLGVLGLWASFVLLYAGMRLARGYRAWKKAHWLSLPVFFACFFHGWMIGTESQSGLYQLFYVCLANMVSVAVLIRFWPITIAVVKQSL